jgi:protein phosphatase
MVVVLPDPQQPLQHARGDLQLQGRLVDAVPPVALGWDHQLLHCAPDLRVIVVFLVGGGAYLASREYFFIGTNSDGIVTIFRGFPYDLPLGIKMYEQFYVSGVPVSAVPADRRAGLLNHQLRSQGNAITLVHAAELGQLAR